MKTNQEMVIKGWVVMATLGGKEIRIGPKMTVKGAAETLLDLVKKKPEYKKPYVKEITGMEKVK